MSRLPPQREFPVFLELLSNLAKQNDVKIIAIEPQKTIETPDLFFVRIPIFIDAYASYHDLGRFINDLEFSKKFMKIDDIKIESEDYGSEKHQIFLSVQAFCLREVFNESLR